MMEERVLRQTRQLILVVGVVGHQLLVATLQVFPLLVLVVMEGTEQRLLFQEPQ
jgi:hypothetical protein